MHCNVPSRPHYVFRVDCRLILLAVILAPAMARAESLELIRDANFANGFRLLSPEPGKREPTGDLKPANATGTPIWELAQWNSRHPLTETAFTNVETWLTVSNAAKWVRVGTGANAGCLELGMDSRPEYDSRPRKTPAEPWTHLLVQQNLPGCPPLTDVAAFRLKLEARLVENETFKPEGYSRDLHAAQFQVVLTIQNIRRDSPGQGDYLWFAVPLFDDRFDEPPRYVNRDYAVSQGKLIFNPGAAAFTSHRLRDGQWVRVDRDLRPLFIEALEEAWRRGYLQDSHHLADYRLTTINIGWEVPGLNRAAIKLREVSLRVERAVAGAGQTTPIDGAEFHVAATGNDVDAGTKSHPFASLARARDAIRELKQQRGLPQGCVTIWVHPGEYPLAESFELTEADAGTADQPIVYRGIDRDGVHLVGGRALPAEAFAKVTDAETLDRLDPAARDNVLGASLPSLGITEYGAFPDQFSGAVPMPELFFNDQRMTLARWPNEDWAEFTQVLESGPAPWRDHASDQLGVFAYEGGRPARWLRAPGVWLQGYWCFDWSCETIRVQDIDTQEQRITLAKQHVYGLGSGNPGPRRFFAVNLL
ncbi:MAG: hypothetical protein L0Z07_07670, partial [Planctomycetes bacterium]|nr:hypothetical protein [Planctomycetota bacterium]